MILLDTKVNPDWVNPGWVPLVLVVVVGLACVGLFFSMRKHIRIARANDPGRAQQPGSDDLTSV